MIAGWIPVFYLTSGWREALYKLTSLGMPLIEWESPRRSA
jgi:hypothetical protein